MKNALFVPLSLLAVSVPAQAAPRHELTLFMLEALKPWGLKTYKPLLEAVGNQVGMPTLLEMESTPEPLTQLIHEGKGDFTIGTYFSYVLFDETKSIEPRMTYWRKGKEVYEGCIFVKQGSPIRKLSDLSGRKLLVERPASTSGYALPLVALLQELPAARLAFLGADSKAPRAKPEMTLSEVKASAPFSDAIGLAFTGGDENSVAWTLAGFADAGAVKCDELEPLSDKVRVLARSPSIPRSLVGFHKALDPLVRDRIERFLSSLSASDPVMKAGEVTRIEPLKPEHRKALEAIRPLLEKIPRVLTSK